MNKIAKFGALIVALAAAAPALAAQCGNSGSGFGQWKQAFAAEARAAGVGQAGLQALANAQYSSKTIAADRNQKGVKYSLDRFIQIRLGSIESFAATARKRKNANPNFFASLERAYGVPAGILLAIHGMETGFGRNMGSVPVVSSILTVAYDCRRSSFFTPHALAALTMVDRGMLSPSQIGAYHGEMGHTQFLPGNALRYGVDANGDGRVNLYAEADALASTANFLRQKGWQPGAGYQQGEPNFRVLNEWNAATVYQQAIALAAQAIDR
jgi:membrane-bound lytic murein transglycosylase B